MDKARHNMIPTTRYCIFLISDTISAQKTASSMNAKLALGIQVFQIAEHTAGDHSKKACFGQKQTFSENLEILPGFGRPGNVSGKL